MSRSDQDITADVDLLVSTGVIPENRREATVGVLRCRERLADIGQGPVGTAIGQSPGRSLDDAIDRLRAAVEALNRARHACDCLLDELAPLKSDRRCAEPLRQLHTVMADFGAMCEAVRVPSGPSGEQFDSMLLRWAEGIEKLRTIVGP